MRACVHACACLRLCICTCMLACVQCVRCGACGALVNPDRIESLFKIHFHKPAPNHKLPIHRPNHVNTHPDRHMYHKRARVDVCVRCMRCVYSALCGAQVCERKDTHGLQVENERPIEATTGTGLLKHRRCTRMDKDRKHGHACEQTRGQACKVGKHGVERGGHVLKRD